MNHILHTFSKWVSSTKGSIITIAVWLIAIVVLSVIAPGAGDIEETTDEDSAHANRPSEEAQNMLDTHFPSDEGPPALLVFQGDGDEKITEAQREDMEELSKWLNSEDKPENVESALEFYNMPEKVQDIFFSDDKTTAHLDLAMKEDLEPNETFDTLDAITNKADDIMEEDGLEMNITGPAGIAADTTSLFKNANFVLMFSTIGLIFVLLMVIYRSPLLAIIPLIVAGLIYSVVDRVLGWSGEKGLFVVDSQATSIMMILLFAVLTDYSLFILSRFRHELRLHDSKSEAMAKAFEPVLKPILFSGITLFIAMIVLFLADFTPYYNFAPVFSIAIIFIFLGGVTLIPAIFALAGRKAFWPFIPRVEKKETEKPNKKTLWGMIGKIVTKKPGITAGILLIVMLAASLNIPSMQFSFNQMESFPDDTDSRVGYEKLADKFPEGELAKTNIVLESKEKIDIDEDFVEQINGLREDIEDQAGIEEVSPDLDKEMTDSDDDLPRDFLAETNKAVQLDVTLEENPYSRSSLNVIDDLRDKQDNMLEDNGLNPDEIKLSIAGETAKQLDVRDMNQRDMMVTFTIITVLIAIMLIFQSGSIVMGLVMIGTMLLSYTATLGLTWFVIENVLGFDTFSYRIPLYTFVFLIALGVDYNIILVSRIREEMAFYDWKEAISRGVSLTGGVISSAGIILAGTFTVLITQPVQELNLFGLMMAIGVLMDTFIVRGMLLPSILTFIKPNQVKKNEN